MLPRLTDPVPLPKPKQSPMSTQEDRHSAQIHVEMIRGDPFGGRSETPVNEGNTMGIQLNKLAINDNSELFPAAEMDETISCEGKEYHLQQYKGFRLIAEGGFGYVYHAIGEPFVIKKSKKPIAGNQRAGILGHNPAASSPRAAGANQNEYMIELEVFKIAKHNHVVQLFGHFVHNGYVCFLLEYANNGSLSKYVMDRNQDLQIDELLALSLGCSLGLDCVHKHGYEHRDIKSDNYLVINGVPKLTDFGLARKPVSLSDTSAGQSNMTQLAGDYHWFSPESCKEFYQCVMSDIFALGVIFWFLLKREQPFTGLIDRHVYSFYQKDKRLPIPDTVPAFKELIDACWREIPESRPTAENLASVLKDWQLYYQQRRSLDNVPTRELKLNEERVESEVQMDPGFRRILTESNVNAQVIRVMYRRAITQEIFRNMSEKELKDLVDENDVSLLNLLNAQKRLSMGSINESTTFSTSIVDISTSLAATNTVGDKFYAEALASMKLGNAKQMVLYLTCGSNEEHRKSKYLLARCMIEGIGTEPDFVKAKGLLESVLHSSIQDKRYEHLLQVGLEFVNSNRRMNLQILSDDASEYDPNMYAAEVGLLYGFVTCREWSAFPIALMLLYEKYPTLALWPRKREVVDDYIDFIRRYSGNVHYNTLNRMLMLGQSHVCYLEIVSVIYNMRLVGLDIYRTHGSVHHFYNAEAGSLPNSLVSGACVAISDEESLDRLDTEAAFYFAELLSRLGRGSAMIQLGDIFEHGRHYKQQGGKGEPNTSQARTWYRQAAMYGHPDAFFRVSMCLRKEVGAKQALQMQINFDSHAANLGCNPAQSNMAGHQLAKAKTPTERYEAYVLHLHAALRGNAESQYELGVMALLKSRYDQVHAKHWQLHAVYWLSLAAENKQPQRAIWALALYYLGRSTHADRSVDIGFVNQAIEYFERFRKATTPAHTDGPVHYYLGICHAKLCLAHSLSADWPRYSDTAVNYFIKATNLGHLSAAYELALCYRDGIGIQQSTHDFARYMKYVADQNHVHACYYYGTYLMQYDFNEGVKYLRYAAKEALLVAVKEYTILLHKCGGSYDGDYFQQWYEYAISLKIRF